MILRVVTAKTFFMDKGHKTIYNRFKHIADSIPDAAAIVEDSQSLTYSQLMELVDRIASKFPKGKHEFVGIVMSHGANQIAALLAVLKMGAAYVPAEPSLPKDRIDYMMHVTNVSFVIDDEFCRNLPDKSVAVTDKSESDKPAYVLFTSGTTGRPKGVVIANRSVVNYAEAFKREFHTVPGDVMLQYSVCSFDIFVEEVFTTLLNGATLAIPSSNIIKGDIRWLMDFVTRHNVTEISGFPYLLADMEKLPSIPSSLRLLISGGDVIRASYISNLRNTGVRIYNTYGPSETTVCATYFRIDNAHPLADGTYSIGKEIKGVEVKILDKNMKEVAPGMTGEICISGEGVGLGYMGNPPEQKNYTTMSDGRRVYRSGDLGYRMADGNIAFLHRKDEQVMILGKRVEPKEVENVLNSAPNVERGVVRGFTDKNGLAYLAAYFVPKSPKFSVKSIRSWLATKLTDFMIPEFFVALKSIPLNRRGKVDMKALPVVVKENDGGNKISI